MSFQDNQGGGNYKGKGYVNYTKIKTFCLSKGIIKKVKLQAINLAKVFVTHQWMKNYQQERINTSKINMKRRNNSTENGEKRMNSHFYLRGNTKAQ